MQESETNKTDIPLPSVSGNKRYLLIDLAKAITILLVVWGHMIQYLHGTEYDYLNDLIFKWIYGFHMPAFALVSGFLYSKSRKTEFGKSIVRKSKQLLLPVISWALVLTILDCVFNILMHEPNSGGFFFHRFFIRCLNDLWFLKGIFICFLLVILVEKTAGMSSAGVFLLTLIALSTLLWPQACKFHLYGFLVPFYFIGYIVGKRVNAPNRIEENRKTQSIKQAINVSILFVVLFVLYLLLLALFQKQHYIYTSGLSLFESTYGISGQIWNDFFRFITGIVGCSMLITSCYAVQTWISQRVFGWIIKISSSTLAIYVISASMFMYFPQLLQRLKLNGVLSRIPDYPMDVAILLPLSLIMIVFCMVFSHILSKGRISVLFLGK